MTSERLRLLFVCSKNQWRSPTAEALFRKRPGYEARSAGTSTGARHHVSFEDIEWAEVILVMEEKHKSKLRAEFGPALGDKPIHVLDIPDDYRFMDPELCELLEESVAAALGLATSG